MPFELLPPEESQGQWEILPPEADKPEQPRGFWAKFSEGGLDAMLKEALPEQLGQRFGDVRRAEAQFQQNDEWNKERARRMLAGESLNGMEQWKLRRINELVQQQKGEQGPAPKFSEVMQGLKDAAVDDPMGLAGQFARALVTHPELLVMPRAIPEQVGALVAKAGRVAQVAGKTAADAAQLGGAVGAESTLGQLNERGTASPGQTGADMLTAAIPLAGARLLADVAVTRAAKKAGKQPSKVVVDEVMDRTQAKVKEGVPVDQALNEALESVKVDPEVIKEVTEKGKAEALPEPREEPAPEPTPEPVAREEPTTEASGEREPAIKAEPAIEPEPSAPRVAEAPPDVPTGVSGEATLSREAGVADPRLLAAIGATGTGAIAGWLLNRDPKEAMVGALAAGGVLAGGKLAWRAAGAAGRLAGKIKDTRYRPSALTEQYFGDVESARLANYRFGEMLKTLVPEAREREALTHYLQGTHDPAVDAPMTPEMQQAARAIQRYFEVLGEKGKQAGILPDQLLDGYVTQLWTGLNRNDGLWRNLVTSLGKRNQNAPGMAPRSRFAMERVIPSYKEGMAQGMIPQTLDVAEIARVYGDNIAKAIANKNLIKGMERTQTPNGEHLIVKDMPDALAAEVSKTAAIIGQAIGGPAGSAIANDIRAFAIRKAPREYVTINHPQLRGFKVHEDVAPVVKWLFDANSPNAATRVAYATSVAAKRGIFSYSLFHVKSLGDAMLGTSMRGWLNVLNGDAYRQLKRGQAGDVVDELVRGGLKIVERPLEGDVTPFTSALKLLEERYPVVGAPAKGMRAVAKAMDGFLWGIVHPTFKTAAGMAAFEKLLVKHPNLPRAEVAKMAASFTNDIFGGLDWFRIADGVQNRMGRDLALAVTSPSGRRFMQILMLAPDWTVATTRAMVKAIPGITSREIAALHQGYVVRSALLYAVIADGLNVAFSGHHFWENQDPTMVDLGDGRKLQLSKHFMEPIHWLLSPGQQALNKLGYVVKEPAELALNQQYLSPKGAPPIYPKDASTGTKAVKGAAHALGSMTPIAGQAAYEQGITPGLSGFFGVPIYGKTEQQAVDAARKSAAASGKDENKAERRVRMQREKQEARP